MIASRLFTVLAAASLVGAFALATIIPPLMPLGEVLLEADRHVLVALQAFVTVHLSAGAWTGVAVPWLERPAWLLPAMVGIVFAGLALSTRPRRAGHKRRRSN